MEALLFLRAVADGNDGAEEFSHDAGLGGIIVYGLRRLRVGNWGLGNLVVEVGLLGIVGLVRTR